MKRIYMLGVCFIIVSLCYSQELFVKDTFTRSQNDTYKINTYLETIYYEDYYSGSLDYSVFSLDTINITIPNRGVTIKYKLYEKDDDKWIGESLNGMDTLIIIINGKKVLAYATFNNESYQISSLDNQLSILVKLDLSRYNDESLCATSNTVSFLDIDSDSYKVVPPPLGLIRVLVAYTPMAASTSFDIVANIKMAVEQTNSSYRNSAVNLRLQLAACICVDYQEVQSEYGYETDLVRFTGKNDGYMDQVHALRDIYSADVCVLVEKVYNNKLGGIARAIYADESTAFCVVSNSALTGNYSFAHEIGHLQGARHDIGTDPNTSPFAYGHGYISPSKRWRTIMAYPVPNTYCARILYWSNPDIIYPVDNTPMGSYNKEDNARVLNQFGVRVANFRPYEYTVIVPNIDIGAAEYSSLVSGSTMENSGNIIVESGGELNMCALDLIKLSPGFHAKRGSKLTINNSLLGTVARVLNTSDVKSSNHTSINNSVESDDGYVNYSNGILNLKEYNLIKKVSIFNLNGIEMEVIVPKSNEVNLLHLSPGIYIVKILSFNNDFFSCSILIE